MISTSPIMENQGLCIAPNYQQTLLLYQPYHHSTDVTTKTGAPLKQSSGLNPMAGAPMLLSQPDDLNDPKLTKSTKNRLYKTEICRSFQEHGKCNYGDRCQYAHGDNEIRQVPRHPKYKTDLCKTYHQAGYCPYGARCHFIHNDPTPSAPQSIPLTVIPSFGTSMGSAGDSPIPSSTGSDSPGSFSPGLLSSDEDPFMSPSTPMGRSFAWPSPPKQRPHYDLSTLYIGARIQPTLVQQTTVECPNRLPVFKRLSSGSG